MRLLIDAGNTRIKLDLMEAASRTRASRVFAFTPDELDAARDWLAALPGRPNRVLGVNVAGDAVAGLLESLIERPIEWVKSSEQALGVRNGYREPTQLGADRWAGMLGLAWHERRRVGAEAAERPSALLAVFGTATTIDTLKPIHVAGADSEAADFDFQGGVILPGPDMMVLSLSQGTANLPKAQGDIALYPAHTHQAIATGVAAAQAGALLRQWLAGYEMYGVAPEIYVSGGGWPSVKDEVLRLLASARRGLGVASQSVHWLDAPVLDGLACLARA